MIRWNMNISYANSYGTGSELRSIESKYCLQESIGSLHHTLPLHIGFGKNHSTRMNSVGKGRIIQPGWTASESRKQKSKIVEKQKTKVFRSCKWPSWFLRKFWLRNFHWNDKIFMIKRMVMRWFISWQVISWSRGWSCVGSSRDLPPLAFVRTWCSWPGWAPPFSSWLGWVVCWCSFPSD